MTDYTVPPKGVFLPNFAWSHSRWNNFRKCPMMYNMSVHRSRFKGLPPYVQSEAAARGDRIHQLSEGLIKGDIFGIPKELSKFEAEYKAVLALEGRAEQDHSVDKNWNPCSPKDWDVIWMRSKMDIEAKLEEGHSLIADVKTGQPRDDHEFQCDLYATNYMNIYKTIEQVTVEMWYTDRGITMQKVYDRIDTDELTEYWEDQANLMQTTKVFQPTPSKDSCMWCDFHQDKGGQCDVGWEVDNG